MLRAKALAVIVTATALLLSSVGAEAAQNVLLIIVDDLRPELPVYGSSRIKAPHIESLAESGVVFANAYSNVPVCGASRASLMTGLRPTRQRFVDYQARADEDAPDVMPLHAWLKSRGYIAESIGKVLHHAPDSAAGWSRRPWAPQAMVPRERRTGHSNYYLQKNIDAFHNNGAGPAFEIADVGDEAYFDGQIAAYAVDSLRRLADQGKPFFLAVGFVKPHLPFTAPRDYWKLSAQVFGHTGRAGGRCRRAGSNIATRLLRECQLC
jgi:arylsulfatase A-like enzyme